jgi:hypothetical protein
VNPEKASGRARKLTWFIDVAENCRYMNNYHSLMEVRRVEEMLFSKKSDQVKFKFHPPAESLLPKIMTGLNNSAVSRLRQSWEQVDANHKKVFEELDHLMSMLGNYKTYRSTLATSDKPCLPFLGTAEE